MQKGKKVLIGLMTLMASLSLFSLALAATESPADFYKKNTVTILVNSKPGGGSDFMGRLFATYWSKVTGGRMIVKNEDGGGGLVAINQVYNGKTDGRTIGLAMLGSQMIAPKLIESESVQFDLTKFTYVGATAPEPYTLLVGKNQPYESLADLQKASKLKFGTSSAAAVTSLALGVTIEFFGLKDARIVPGFRTADLGVAAARKEIDGFVKEGAAALGEIKKEYVKPPLFSLTFERTNWFPNTPTLPELMKLSPDQLAVFKILTSLQGGKLIYAPPGLPEDRREFLRDTYDKIMTIDGFVNQMKTLWPIWGEPIKGKDAIKQVNEAMSFPKKDVDKFKEIVTKHVFNP